MVEKLDKNTELNFDLTFVTFRTNECRLDVKRVCHLIFTLNKWKSLAAWRDVFKCLK